MPILDLIRLQKLSWHTSEHTYWHLEIMLSTSIFNSLEVRLLIRLHRKVRCFFVTWYYALVNLTDVDTWAFTAITSIVAALLLILVYLFGPSVLWRKVGFFGALTFFVLFLCSNLFAFQQKDKLNNRTGAIVITPSVNVRTTPIYSGTTLFVIHEGTRVDIIDKMLHDWIGVRLDDGREGWIPSKAIEII